MEKEDSGMIKLTSSNYFLWKTMMEDHLYCNDLALPIECKGIKPDEMDDAKWNGLNRKATANVRKWVSSKSINHISQEHDCYTVWKMLEETFAKESAQNKVFVIRDLVNLKYRDGEDASVHINVFQGFLNQLSLMNLELADEMQALILLSSLPDSWETLVVSLSNSTPNGKITLKTVKDCILNEEKRRKGTSTSESHALVTESRGRSPSRFSHSKQDRESSNRKGKWKPRGRSQSRKGFKCYYCDKPGHMQKDCRKYKRDKKGKDEDKNEENGTAAVVFDGDVAIVCDDGCVNLACQDTTWIADSAASYHVTPRRDFYTSYTAGDFGQVRMGNQGIASVVGIGDIWLETNTGCKLLLKDVRHVPDMRLHLISTGTLDEEGYHNYFGDGKWKLSRNSLIVAKGKKMGLYMSQAKVIKGEVNAIEDCSTDLWHKRLGHLSEKGLGILAKKNYLPLKGMNLNTCTHCLAGKQHRVAFQRTPPHRRSHVLDLVHTDVCSMIDKSLGGALYFVSFIDDHSRKIWATCLKSKDQVLDVFKDFHARVERETGRKLKCIRADNGGEYRGPFEKYCREHGIKLEKTVPKTPQQNGVAERMNRTIVERIRCMLSHAKLPKSFWGEAMKTAVAMINLSPSVPLDFDVPDRVWKGKDVSYAHLRVFGCRAFVHVPRDERSKLDSKTKQCIFLGSEDDEFGYRLWDPKEKKIVRSRDVIFFEDQTIEDFEQKEKTESTTFIPSNSNPRPTPQLPLMPANHGGDLQNDDNGGFLNEPLVGDPESANDDVDVIPEQVMQEAPDEPQLRRSTRPRQPSTKYSPHEYVLVTDEGEP